MRFCISTPRYTGIIDCESPLRGVRKVGEGLDSDDIVNFDREDCRRHILGLGQVLP